ncbi:MAG: hypothetical protein P4L46_05975 [Fimbriimonas sp.]|nr:hypothetical protein [Fimbriimonas sp.]
MGPIQVGQPLLSNAPGKGEPAPPSEVTLIDPEHVNVMRDVASTKRRFEVVLGIDRLGVAPDEALIPNGGRSDEVALSRQLSRNVAFLNTFGHPLVAPIWVQRRPNDKRMYGLGARLAASLKGNANLDTSIVQAGLRDDIVAETQLPPDWQSEFAFVDYGLLQRWEDLVYRARATKGLTDFAGRTAWNLELPDTVLEGLQRSVMTFGRSRKPYAILIGNAEAIHRSKSSPEQGSSAFIAAHGSPESGYDDFFVGSADPWGIPLRGSLFPGIATHAALVNTIISSPTVELNWIGSLLIDILMILLSNLGLRLLSKVAQFPKQQTDAAKTPINKMEDSTSSTESHSSSGYEALPETKVHDHTLIRAIVVLGETMLRIFLMLLVFFLAVLLRDCLGIYWDGWIVVVLFATVDVLVGGPLEKMLDYELKNGRRAAHA